MSSQGQTPVNFGSGALEASVTIAQANIASSSLVEAWMACNDQIGSFNDDSAWVEEMQAVATYIVPGVGFTIIAKPVIGKAYGAYNVNWVWN